LDFEARLVSLITASISCE